MCGCGKSAPQGAANTFEVVLADGAVRFAKSELEAKVMIARAGGGRYKALEPA